MPPSGSTASSADLGKPAYIVPISMRPLAVAPSCARPAAQSKRKANKPHFARVTVPGAKVDVSSVTIIKTAPPSTSLRAKSVQPLSIKTGKHEKRVAAKKAKLVDAFSSDPKGACVE